RMRKCRSDSLPPNAASLHLPLPSPSDPLATGTLHADPPTCSLFDLCSVLRVVQPLLSPPSDALPRSVCEPSCYHGRRILGRVACCRWRAATAHPTFLDAFSPLSLSHLSSSSSSPV
ncbi:unnamed protein product, partial [Urochloa humidicola]